MNLNVFKQLAQLFESKAANNAPSKGQLNGAKGLGMTKQNGEGLSVSQAKFIEFLKAKGVESLDESKLKALMAEHLGVKKGFIDEHGLKVSVQFSQNLLKQAEQEGIHFTGTNAELSEEVVGKRVNRQQTRAKGKQLAEQEAEKKQSGNVQNGKQNAKHSGKTLSVKASDVNPDTIKSSGVEESKDGKSESAQKDNANSAGSKSTDSKTGKKTVSAKQAPSNGKELGKQEIQAKSTDNIDGKSTQSENAAKPQSSKIKSDGDNSAAIKNSDSNSDLKSDSSTKGNSTNKTSADINPKTNSSDKSGKQGAAISAQAENESVSNNGSKQEAVNSDQKQTSTVRVKDTDQVIDKGKGPKTAGENSKSDKITSDGQKSTPKRDKADVNKSSPSVKQTQASENTNGNVSSEPESAKGANRENQDLGSAKTTAASTNQGNLFGDTKAVSGNQKKSASNLNTGAKKSASSQQISNSAHSQEVASHSENKNAQNGKVDRPSENVNKDSKSKSRLASQHQSGETSDKVTDKFSPKTKAEHPGVQSKQVNPNQPVEQKVSQAPNKSTSSSNSAITTASANSDVKASPNVQKSNVSNEQIKPKNGQQAEAASSPKTDTSKTNSTSSKNGMSWNQGKIKGHQYLGVGQKSGPASNSQNGKNGKQSVDRAELSKPGVKAQQQEKGNVGATAQKNSGKTSPKVSQHTVNAQSKSQLQSTSGQDKLGQQQKAAQGKSNATGGNQKVDQPAPQSGKVQGAVSSGNTGSEQSGTQKQKNFEGKQQPQAVNGKQSAKTASTAKQDSGNQEPRLAMDTKRSEIASDKNSASSGSSGQNGNVSAGGSQEGVHGAQSGSSSSKMTGNGTVHASDNVKAAAGKSDASQTMFRNDAAAMQFARQELPSKIVQVVQRYPVRSQSKGGEQWHRHRIILDKGEALNLTMQKTDGTLQVHISTGNAEMTKLLQQHLQQIKAHLQEQLNVQVEVQLQQESGAEAQSGFQDQLTEQGDGGSGGANPLDIASEKDKGSGRTHRRPRLYGFNNNEWTG